jgi:MinD superfamily P-loop ATPase
MKIAVASGKGGTGKTLVAVSLALSLAEIQEVQLLDCDVEEPNDHIFLKPEIHHSENVCVKVPNINESKCTYCGLCARVCAYHAIAVFKPQALVFAQLCHGCGACGYLCPEKAIDEEPRAIGTVESGYAKGVSFVQGVLTVGEALAPPVIREVKRQARSGGTVIIDTSPGTSCPVVQAVKGSDFCVLVTEPTPFGFNDLRLAIDMVRELDVPFGIVLNRVDIKIKDTYRRKIDQYLEREGIPLLLTIPLDTGIARLYSKGISLVEALPAWKKRFIEVFDKIVEMTDERSSRVER